MIDIGVTIAVSRSISRPRPSTATRYWTLSAGIQSWTSSSWRLPDDANAAKIILHAAALQARQDPAAERNAGAAAIETEVHNVFVAELARPRQRGDHDRYELHAAVPDGEFEEIAEARPPGVEGDD